MLPMKLSHGKSWSNSCLGMGCVAPMSLSSYPVSLEAGMNTDFSRKGKSLTHTFKSLDIKESQVVSGFSYFVNSKYFFQPTLRDHF